MSTKQRKHFICTACGLENLTEFDYCIACKTPMLQAGPVAATPDPAGEPMRTELRCPGCSALYEPGWNFCDQCGRPLNIGGPDVPLQGNPPVSATFSMKHPQQVRPVVRQAPVPPSPQTAQIVGQSPDIHRPCLPDQQPGGQLHEKAGIHKTDGNTSGTRGNSPLPKETSGFSFAGAIPFGAYAYANGLNGLGCLGLLGTFTPLGPIYFLILLIKGKEMAWQNRTYASVEQFQSTMRIWNGWGVFCLTTIVILSVVIAMAMDVLQQIVGQVVGGMFGGLLD